MPAGLFTGRKGSGWGGGGGEEEEVERGGWGGGGGDPVAWPTSSEADGTGGGADQTTSRIIVY